MKMTHAQMFLLLLSSVCIGAAIWRQHEHTGRSVVLSITLVTVHNGNDTRSQKHVSLSDTRFGCCDEPIALQMTELG
jgi:hypothetical protein